MTDRTRRILDGLTAQNAATAPAQGTESCRFRYGVPTKAWKTEYAKLTAERKTF